MEGQLFTCLEKNKQKFEKIFEQSADFYFKYIQVMGHRGAVVMCEDLASFQVLRQIFLHPLNDLPQTENTARAFDYIKDSTTIPFNSKTAKTFEESVFLLTAGFALLFLDGINQAFVMSVQNYPARGVDQPTNENNLRGSKESFTDTGRKNMGMIRRRIRSENLVIKTMQLGEKTKTEVTMYYHSDYCPPQLAQRVQERLENIQLPMIFEAGYISPFVDKTQFSVFQSVGYTERPDTFCAKLCEGRVGVIIDGTPHRMIYPFYFHENFITNDDYTQRPYFASFIRLLRYLAFVIAVVLPGFYVAFTSYAPQALADKLIFFIYSSQNATPLPLFVEAVVITILLEIIKEAGLRLPVPIGSSVSIVSALIIGDAAVSAGFIGSAILIVCALSTVASFIIPSFYEPIIIMRMLFILLAGIFGIPGIAFATFLLAVNIANVDSAGGEYSFIFQKGMKYIFRDGITRTSWRREKSSSCAGREGKDEM